MRIISLVLLILCALNYSDAQTLSSLRKASLPLSADTVTVDTLSVAPGTLILRSGDIVVDTSAYYLDFINSRIIWKKNSPEFLSLKTDSVQATYRVFSFLLGKEYRNKGTELISGVVTPTPLYYNPGSDQPELFQMPGLTRNGSISRGITFGNNQDVFVNSSLNLQLAGKLSENIDILAAITDENIPIQPEGNTQQLQDFDKVFIQLSDKRNKLIAGDFELRRPDSYFMNFFKKGQGGYFTTEIPLTQDASKKRLLRSGVSVAVSKGKFARNTVEVREGNQGPYRLTGNNGESFIIILSGTEKIYIDGVQLERGSQNDYIIDYNTAELTFTAKRIITKDSRVVAEFEYSDKNYARSLIFFNTEFESDKLKLKLNLYSEQDSKNQPVALDLDSAQKALMASVGDSIQYAFYPTADSIAFTSNTVLYEKRDTTTSSGTFSIYVYSTDPAVAYWQVGFSEVGTGRGDYVLDITSANGRVFRWVEPTAGVPQGNYAPVTLLITPKKQQMMTVGADYKINDNNFISVETAASNYDVNLFSAKDKSNDAGFATKIQYKNIVPLSSDSVDGWKLTSVVNYEYSGKNFKPIERYRNVEFERDWNLGTSNILNDEHVSSFQTTLSKSSLLRTTYQLRSYNKGKDYNGLMNMADVNLHYLNFNVLASGSYLTTEGLNSKSNFIRHQADISRPFWKLVVGVRENAEQNKFTGLQSDTLLASSFSFQEYSGYLALRDSIKSKAAFSYKQRTDNAPKNNGFAASTFAEEMNLTTEFSGNPNNRIRTTTTYRTLRIRDTTLSTQEPAKTILNRIEHTLNVWKGILSFNTYYEVGTGQERKQEYYYLKVNDGQGVYAWLDSNNDGVEDLSEFVIAAFQDQASYIRVYIPTREYIDTRSNQFSEVLSITPAGRKSSSSQNKLFIHRFTDQFSVRLDRKTKDESLLSSLNPFHQELADTQLISSSVIIRNTLYFNRNSPVFGCDLTWQENRNKSFLTNGFETRTQRLRLVNARYNINRAFLVNVSYENSDRLNTSDYFSNRDYSIFANSIEPKLTYQPGNSFRVSASYKYGDKRNAEGTIHERAISNRFQLESKYTTLNAGNFTAKVSFINVSYNAEDNSYLSYEMLEGLKNGKNITWGTAIQRNLSTSMQLSLSYDGRKLQDSPVVHTGGVQFRAYF